MVVIRTGVFQSIPTIYKNKIFFNKRDFWNKVANIAGRNGEVELRNDLMKQFCLMIS